MVKNGRELFSGKVVVVPESIKWLIENQAFLPSYDLATPPPLPQSTVSKLSLFLNRPVCHRSSLLTGDGGKRQILGRRESLVLYKSFCTLWGFPMLITDNGEFPHQVTIIAILLWPQAGTKEHTL
jgi:hypothetical protein